MKIGGGLGGGNEGGKWDICNSINNKTKNEKRKKKNLAGPAIFKGTEFAGELSLVLNLPCCE